MFPATRPPPSATAVAEMSWSVEASIVTSRPAAIEVPAMTREMVGAEQPGASLSGNTVGSTSQRSVSAIAFPTLTTPPPDEFA